MKDWTVKDGLAEIQKHYDEVANLYNGGRYDEIAGLYHDTSIIVARKARRLFNKKTGAVAFWKWVAKKKIKNIKFTVEKAALAPAGHSLRVGQVYQGTLQKVCYLGTITYDLCQDDPSGDFSGDGFHMDDCSFGRPEGEGFDW